MELLNIYDIDGNLCGTMSRAECHKSTTKFFHKHVHIWILNDKNEVLFQLRSHHKKHHPLMWEVCGGHESAGETGKQACAKEIFEELGVKIDLNEIFLLDSMIIDNSITEIYTTKINCPTTEFVLQESEVEECFWLPLKDVHSFCTAPHFDPLPDKYSNEITSKLKEFWKIN